MTTTEADDAGLVGRREIETLRSLAKSLSAALLEVCPLGGSEMFQRIGDDYYADPVYIGHRIRENHNRLHVAVCDQIKADRRALAAEAKLASVRAALDAAIHIINILRAPDQYSDDAKVDSDIAFNKALIATAAIRNAGEVS